jgi:hypothetical protein
LAKAEKEAAEARERAARIERATAWRRVGDRRRARLAESLVAIASTVNVAIEFQTSDIEAWSFASEIKAAFEGASVASSSLAANTWLSGNVFGLHVQYDGLDPHVAAEIGGCLGGPFQMASADLALKLTPNQVRPNLYIFVGAKIPIELMDNPMTSTRNP